MTRAARARQITVTSYDSRLDKSAVTIAVGDMSAAFERYVGIDYSGAETCESSLKGLRVYMADRATEPHKVAPPPWLDSTFRGGFDSHRSLQ